MKQFHTIKLLVLLLAAIVFGNTTFAQVTYNEGFESATFPPAGWTLATSSSGNNIWTRRTTGTFPTCTPHGGAVMARFNSHTVGAGNTQALITPVINYASRGNNAATFSLWIYRDTDVAIGADSLTILVNTTRNDTTATRLGAIARNTSINLPDIQTSSGWYQYSFNVPSSFNSDTNYIIVLGTSQAGFSMYIDDIQWVAFPTPCTGTPAIGSISANPPQICGGHGASALSLPGALSGFGGLSVQWQTSTSATGPWTTFDSVYNSNTGNLIATTYYRSIISCSISGSSDTSKVDTIIVSANPAPVVGINPNAANYCSGGPAVSLTANGANTYSWSPPTGLNTTTDSTVLASPTINTRYTVTGTDTAGCTGTAQVLVNVRTGPVLTIAAAPDSICTGDSTTLSVTATGFTGGATFLWTPDSLTGQSVNVGPASSTQYTVSTVGGGCPSSTSAWVYASAPAVSAFGYSINSHTVTFQDSSSNAANWSWSFGDGNTSANQNPVYTYGTDGSYTVQLITSGFCAKKDTLTKTVIVNTAGINSPATANSFSVYPNPAQNYTMVECNTGQVNAQLSIINTLGDVVATYAIAGKQQIDISKLATGVYTLRLTTQTQTVNRQLVKE